MVDKKRCTGKCQQKKPDSKEYFYVLSSGLSLDCVCKTCRNKASVANAKKKYKYGRKTPAVGSLPDNCNW